MGENQKGDASLKEDTDTGVKKERVAEPSPTPTRPTANLNALSPVTDEDHILGEKDAPVTLIEFSDFECPFCRRHLPNLKRLLQEYDGKVRLVYRHSSLSTAFIPMLKRRLKHPNTPQSRGNFGNTMMKSLQKPNLV